MTYSQLVRVCKSEIQCVIRCYGTYRYQKNYYEILNVSPDASQNEIKQAFFKLSKQLHPDICGKHSHVDFVKLNEAYSVLGKENTRREYDFNLKCNKYHPSYTYTAQNKRYASQWEYEVRAAGGPWPPPNAKPNAPLGLAVALLFLGFGIVQIIFIFHSWQVRKRAILRSDRLKLKYQQIRNATYANYDNRHSVRDHNSAKDLEYLDKSSNK